MFYGFSFFSRWLFLLQSLSIGFFTSLSPAPSLRGSPLFWNNITAKSRGCILATLVPGMVGRWVSPSVSLIQTEIRPPTPPKKNYLMEFYDHLTFHLLPPAGQSFYLSSEIFQHLRDGLASIFICGCENLRLPFSSLSHFVLLYRTLLKFWYISSLSQFV